MSAPDGPPPGMPPGGMPPMPPVPDIPADGPVKVGVFVPSGVPDVDPRVLRDWARLIDAGPWSSLAVTDRVAYANLDPLMTLAMLAPLTERVTLSTSILLPGLRDPHTLAKQVASLVRMAPGRVSLGVGVGARPWDHEAKGDGWGGRGPRPERAAGGRPPGAQGAGPGVARRRRRRSPVGLRGHGARVGGAGPQARPGHGGPPGAAGPAQRAARRPAAGGPRDPRRRCQRPRHAPHGRLRRRLRRRRHQAGVLRLRGRRRARHLGRRGAARA